jgi:hypothetical protein
VLTKKANEPVLEKYYIEVAHNAVRQKKLRRIELKMKLRRKQIITAIALILVLPIASLMATTSIARGQSSNPIVQTTAFLAVEPNPVGVGQTVVISDWIEPLEPTANDLSHGFTVNITSPSGIVTTYANRTSFPGAYDYILYTPAAVGTYQIKFFYPGELFTSKNLTYTASTSQTVNFTVQQSPVQSYPDVPIPTNYWTRPINAQFRTWTPISGDWLFTAYNSSFNSGTDTVAAQNPYSQSVLAPHIMWTAPVGEEGGGIAGGQFGDAGTFYPGNAYEPLLIPPLVMNGVMYYDTYQFGEFPGFTAVNLRTGQQLYQNPNYTINFGMEYNFESANQFGIVGPYLWQTAGSTWNMFNAQTGQLIASFANASSGTLMNDNVGEVLAYILSPTQHRLALWNSTLMFQNDGFYIYSINTNPPNLNYGEFRPRTGTFNWLTGIQWNVTIPAYGPAPFDPTLTQNSESIVGITANSLVCQIGTSSESYLLLAYDLTTGQQLFAENSTYASAPSNYDCVGAGLFYIWNPPAMDWIAFNATTGAQVWTSTPNTYPWGTYITRAIADATDGIFLDESYDGYVHAISIATGQQVWAGFAGNSGAETPYGVYPMRYGPIVSQGVVYVATGEHSPNTPLYRGERLLAFNTTTGQQLWNMTSWFDVRAIADGYLIGYNQYDNQMYILGKGPSATTVDAPMTAITLGSAVTIRGTVTDQSAGQPGTPAISDASMANWMQNLKQQMPLSGTVTGVQVTLTANDPNHNTEQLGTVTSDMYGNYGLTWKPPVPGLYQIIATFQGSNSYGNSAASTYLSVT